MDFRAASSVVLLFLAFGILEGEALMCHQCSTYTDAQCADPFYFDEVDESGKRIIKTTDFLKECPSDDKEYTLCRKILQYVRGEERVIRSCGWIEYKYDCYKTVMEEYNTYVCACKGEGCNGGGALSSSFFSVVLMTLGAYLVKIWQKEAQ